MSTTSRLSRRVMAAGGMSLVALSLVTSALLFLTVSEGWARDPNGVWRPIDGGATKPGIRKHSTLTYDADRKRLVLFGGDKDPSGAYSDLWTFQLPSGPWAQLFPDDATDCTSTSRPCRRHGHVAAYFPGSPPSIRIHGGKLENNCVINDTWKLTLGCTPYWARVWYTTSSGPLIPMSRWHHAMVNWNGSAQFFGGETLGGVCTPASGIGMCDTWSFNGSSWSHVSGNKTASGSCPTPPFPDRRYQHSLIVDTWNYRLMTFGGVYEAEIGTSNTWWSDNGGGTWTSLGDAPAGYSRALHTATYDPVGKRMVVIGGYDTDFAIVSAVTSMDIAVTGTPSYGTWSTLNTSGSGPGPISEHAAAYDPDADRIIVFGGVDQNGSFRNDLWALDFADADVTAPNAVSNLAFTGVTPSSATVRWTAPGDDGTTGTAMRYDIRYSESPISDDASFAAAAPHTCAPNPALAMTLQSTTISGLTSGLTYYFAMKTLDEHGNVSALSNVIFICIPYTPNTLCDDFLISPPGEETDSRLKTAFGLRDLGAQPAGVPLQVHFGLEQSGPVTIEMFDVAGRSITRMDLAGLGPGEHTQSLIPRSRLAAGLYLVRLRQGNTASTERVVLLQQ